MKYLIEKWLQNDIGKKDLERLTPLKLNFSKSDTFYVDFKVRDSSDNVLLQAEIETENYLSAIKKFSEYLENVLSKISFISATPINIITQSPTLVIKFIDNNKREGFIQVPEDKPAGSLFHSDDEFIDEGFEIYLEYLSNPEYLKKLEEYKIPLSFFRLSIINSYPIALLFQYFAIEALIKSMDIISKCFECGENLKCNCEGKIHKHNSKSSKELRELMDEMGFHPIVKKKLEELRHKFSHGNADLFDGLILANNLARDLQEELQKRFSKLNEEIEKAYDVADERVVKKEINITSEDENLSKLLKERVSLHQSLNRPLFDETGLKFRNYIFKKIFPDKELPPRYFTRRSYPFQFFAYDTVKMPDSDMTLGKIKNSEEVYKLFNYVKIESINEPLNF